MNNSQQPQIGLVLAGGGARGAYQAGALRYLAEIGLQPQIIAGTSIGALNGATLAANNPFNYAVQRLNDLWTELGTTKIAIENNEKIDRVNIDLFFQQTLIRNSHSFGNCRTLF